MFENKGKIKLKRDIILKRLLFLLLMLLVFLLVLDKTSLMVLIGLIVVLTVYLFGREKIWHLLILSAPVLCFGELLYIPITPGWIYEAHLSEIFIGLTAAVFALDLYFNEKLDDLKFDKTAFWLFVLMILSVLSFFWARDMRLYVYALKIPVFGFLAYFLALNLIDSKRKIKYFLSGLALTALILSIQVFYKFYTLGFSSDFFFNRSNILIPIGPIATTAAILAFLTPALLGFYYYLPSANKLKPLILSAFLLAFLAVFLTLGKGAILSLLFGLLIIFYAYKQKRIAIALFFFWFLALAYLGFQPYFEGLYERLKTTFVDVNTEFRLKEYQISQSLIEENPLIGVGAGQQIYHYEKMLDQEQGNFVNNFFLQSIIDLGIIGLFITIFIVKSLAEKVLSVFRNKDKDYLLLIGLIASIATAFLNGMVEVTFYALPYAIIFWLLIGVFSELASSE